MEELDSILGEAPEAAEAEVEEAQEPADNEATGEEVETQVAAEESHEVEEAPQPSKVKAELAALAKERERIRQKEAALDEERSRLTDTKPATPPNEELKELRKQHRQALSASLLDPDDDDSAKLVDELEDKMEALRLSMIHQSQKQMTEQERSVSDYQQVFQTVHDEYPFLDVNHPDVSAELNEDINAYYEGRVSRGDTPAAALRKAVDKFAPAYAAKFEDQPRKTQPKPKLDTATRERLGKSGFSEVRSASRTEVARSFTGPTPLASILGKT